MLVAAGQLCWRTGTTTKRTITGQHDQTMPVTARTMDERRRALLPPVLKPHGAASWSAGIIRAGDFAALAGDCELLASIHGQFRRPLPSRFPARGVFPR